MIKGIKAVVFDAYGTLFDFSSAVMKSKMVPEELKSRLSATWREKQIQYTLLRSMQGKYDNFFKVTEDSLVFSLNSLNLYDEERKKQLLTLYKTLSAYPEVSNVLSSLKDSGFKTAILSNGTYSMLSDAITSANIQSHLDEVISVEDVSIYKPSSVVYELAENRLKVKREEILFISSNGWDAYGASAFGLKVAWCNRTNQPNEMLPGSPDIIISNLSELIDKLNS